MVNRDQVVLSDDGGEGNVGRCRFGRPSSSGIMALVACLDDLEHRAGYGAFTPADLGLYGMGANAPTGGPGTGSR